MSEQFANFKEQSGFTLLEVLVAVIVLSIGLIGLAGMQSSALVYNKDSLQRSQAVAIAGGVMDAMRANRSGNYEATGGGILVANQNANDSGTIAQRDQGMWQRRLFAELGPGSTLNVCRSDNAGQCGAGDFVRVIVTWSERGSQNSTATQQVAFVGRV